MFEITPTDIQFGDVYWATIANYGSAKKRPWCVVSDVAENKGPTVRLIPGSTMPPRHTRPTVVSVVLKPHKNASYFNCELELEVDKSLLQNFERQLTQDEQEELMRGLASVKAPMVRTAQKATTHSVDNLLEWDDVLTKPMEWQNKYVAEQMQYFTVKELCGHWGIHHNTLYARVGKVEQKSQEAKEAAIKEYKDALVPTPAPIEAAEAPGVSLQELYDALGMALSTGKDFQLKVRVDGKDYNIAELTAYWPLSGKITQPTLAIEVSTKGETK